MQQLQHLLQEEAPVLAAPVGRTTLQLLPKPIQVPADFETLRADLDDLIGQFSTHFLGGSDRDWVWDPSDSSEDSPADPWVAEGDGLVSKVRSEVVGCASAFASRINTLLPPLVGERYEVRPPSVLSRRGATASG